jgi:uncharacterized membrane protein
MGNLLHALHLLVAGIWVGGLVFTIAVVSPAFKRMNWTQSERSTVRSEVGRQYARITHINLPLFFCLAVADWVARGFNLAACIESICIVLALVLSELHARYFVPRLVRAAREQAHELRARLLRLSICASMLNLLLSAIALMLAA